MAWLDDRVWSHPKFADLSAAAFRSYVYGVCYSSGFGTRGKLTSGMLKTLCVTRAQRRALTDAGLWHETGDGIAIHDWENHNGKRDDRRARDRERKRKERATERGQSADNTAERPQDSPQERPGERPQSRRVLKEVKEVKEEQTNPNRGLDNGPLRDNPELSAYDWDHILKPIPD